MIEISNLKYRYAGAKQYVFNNFSLSLSENNIYGLLGKNGMASPPCSTSSADCCARSKAR